MASTRSFGAIFFSVVMSAAGRADAQAPASNVAECVLRLNVGPDQPRNPIQLGAMLQQNCRELCGARAWSVGASSVCEWGATMLFTQSGSTPDPNGRRYCYARDAVHGDRPYNLSALGAMSQADCSAACAGEASRRGALVVCGFGDSTIAVRAPAPAPLSSTDAAVCSLRLSTAQNQPPDTYTIGTMLRANCDSLCRAQFDFRSGSGVCDWGGNTLFSATGAGHALGPERYCYARNDVSADRPYNVAVLGTRSNPDCQAECASQARSRGAAVICGWGSNTHRVPVPTP